MFTCSNVNVTCSGTTSQVAKYKCTGTQGQQVTINSPATSSMTNQLDNTPTAFLIHDGRQSRHPGPSPTSGTPGTEFSLGGSITVDSTTADGVYIGNFDVTVEY